MIEELTIRLANKISRRTGISKEQVIFLALTNYLLDYPIHDLDEDLEALLDVLQHLIPGENITHDQKLLEKITRTLTHLQQHSPQFCNTLLPTIKHTINTLEDQCKQTEHEPAHG